MGAEGGDGVDVAFSVADGKADAELERDGKPEAEIEGEGDCVALLKGDKKADADAAGVWLWVVEELTEPEPEREGVDCNVGRVCVALGDMKGDRDINAVAE